jgi:hypothetical protein
MGRWARTSRSCKLHSMRLLKIVAIFLGILFALAGLALVTSGGFLLGVYGTHGDTSGYFTSPQQQVGSYGFALTAPNVNATLGSRWQRWVPTWGDITVRVQGNSEMPAPLFIGVGPTARVSKYLSGVPHDKITDIDWVAGSVQYVHVDGRTLPSAPGKQSFWVAKTQGTGLQTLEWKLEPGDWTVTIMNADASAPVAATMSIGAHFGIITRLVIGLVAGGLVLLAIATTLIWLGTRRRPPRRPVQVGHSGQQAQPVYPPAPPTASPPAPTATPTATQPRTPTAAPNTPPPARSVAPPPTPPEDTDPWPL